MLKIKKKFKVLITWKFIIDYLKTNNNFKKFKNFKFKFFSTKQAVNEKKLLQLIKDHDAIVCGDDEITKKVLQKGKNLKVIAKWGTGIDSIDQQECKKRKVKIINTPGAFTNSVSQLCLGFILDYSRKICETNELIKKNLWPKKTGFILEGKTLGLIGFGKIGKEISKLSSKLGMKIIFYDIKKIKSKFNQTSKTNLLNKSDIIVVACNLNKTSYKLIKFEDFKKMKKRPGFINIARGKIVDEESLIKALEKKMIRYAGIDVFENEPISKSNKLKKYKNVTLSSHNAFNCFENIEKVNIGTLKKLEKALKT